MVAIALPVVLQLILVLVASVRYSHGNFYQRCRSAVVAYGGEAANVTSSTGAALLRDLQETSVCSLCEDYDGPNEDAFDSEDDVFRLYDDDDDELDSSVDDEDDEHALHVVIMVGSSACLERVLILASGMLSMRVHVTLVIENKSNLPAEAIFNAFIQHIPCHDHDLRKNLTTTSSGVTGSSDARSIRRRKNRRRSAPGNINALLQRLRFILLTTKKHCEEDLACHVSNAPTVLEALLENERMIVSADVAIVDGVFVAGMLMAEANKIPALYLMETPAVYSSFLSLADAPVIASAARWWQPATALLRHRWRSLDFPFAALNRIRTQTFGLARIRELSELWHAGVMVLPYAARDVPWTQLLSDPLLVINGTYLPPCMPCDYQLHQQRTSSLAEGRETGPFVIVSVSFPGNDLGRTAMRKVVRALSLARSSLVECTSTKVHQTPRNDRYHGAGEAQPSCWNYTNPLEIVVLGQRDLLFPSFVHVTTTSFLDALALYAPVVAIVASCDESNSVWKYALGPPVICVDRRDDESLYESAPLHGSQDQHSGASFPRRSAPPAVDVEQLAIRVLRAVTSAPSAPNESLAHASGTFSGFDRGESSDALVQFVRVAQLLAAHKAEKGDDWSDGWDVKRSMVRLLFRTSPSKLPYVPPSSTALYVAWLVLLLSAFYLLLRNVNVRGSRVGVVLLSLSAHHHPRSTHLNGGSPGTSSPTVGTGLMLASVHLQVRLQELQRVWRIWSRWGADLWAQMQDAESPRGMPSSGPELDPISLSTEDQDAASGARSSAPGKRRLAKSKRH